MERVRQQHTGVANRVCAVNYHGTETERAFSGQYGRAVNRLWFRTVRRAHQLKRLYGGSIRSNRAELTERAHHALHTGLRPDLAIDALYLMGRD